MTVQVTRRLCLCEERLQARDDKRFVYDATYGGWVFPLGPRRRMTAKARYVASTRPGYVDHAGESYVFETCPFCGGDLPLTPPHWPLEDAGEGTE